MTTKKKKESAFMKPLHVSDALAAVIGKGPMPRTEAIKKLWNYIRKHKLQNAKNKRQIIPDQALSKVLGSSPVDMFKMPGKLSKHLS